MSQIYSRRKVIPWLSWTQFFFPVNLRLICRFGRTNARLVKFLFSIALVSIVSNANCAFCPNQNSLNCTVTQNDTPKSYSDPSDLPQEGAMFAQNTGKSGFDFIKTIKMFYQNPSSFEYVLLFMFVFCACACLFWQLFQDTRHFRG